MSGTALLVPPGGRERPAPLSTGDLLALAVSLADAERVCATLEVPATRSWRTIAATEEYEAFVIAWPVGGAIDLHDHGASAGAVVVVSGVLVETVVARAGDGSLQTDTKPLAEGDRVHVAAGHIHDIANHGPGPAVSVHVYSPALSTMTFFEPTGGSELVAVRTEEFREAGSHR